MYTLDILACYNIIEFQLCCLDMEDWNKFNKNSRELSYFINIHFKKNIEDLEQIK